MAKALLSIEAQGVWVIIKIKYENGDTEGADYQFDSEESASAAVLSTLPIIFRICKGAVTTAQDQHLPASVKKLRQSKGQTR